MGLVELLPDDPQPGRRRQQNTEPPQFPGAPMHFDRLIVELLRSLVVAVEDGDVGQDQQRAAVLHFFTAGSDGLSRRHRECGSLLVLAELKRGEALKK